MSSRRPKLMSQSPLRISAPTASVPSATPEIALTSFPAHRELLDMPNVIPDMDVSDEDSSWDCLST